MRTRWLLSATVFVFLSTANGKAHAQATCVSNQDGIGNVCTSFSLGPPTVNCIPVITQDGAATGGQGAVCPSGFFGGAGLQIWLPKDPVSPGSSLSMYACTVAVVSNTVPASNSKTQGQPGSLVQSLSCPISYSYFDTTWTGTLTYDYVSALQRHCTSGRGAHCVTAYYPVWAGGAGELATPQPPAPPPPPPPPPDGDGDGVPDDFDNCPAIPNPDQADRDLDGIGDVCDFCPDYASPDNNDTDGNGIGDVCECGDQTQDGTVNVLDVVALNLLIFGAAEPSPLCDTNDDGICDVQDLVGVNKKIFGQPAYCSQYPPPPAPPPVEE
jgi:hypothetical protein